VPLTGIAFVCYAAFLGSDVYLLGGTTGSAGMSDVWKCTGGTCASWTVLTNNAGFGARHSACLVAFNSQLTLIGGMTGSSTYYRHVSPFLCVLFIVFSAYLLCCGFAFYRDVWQS
jgi:hypothetical protein